VTDPVSSLDSTKGVPCGCMWLCTINFVTPMEARIMSTMVAFLPAQSVSGPISKKACVSLSYFLRYDTRTLISC